MYAQNFKTIEQVARILWTQHFARFEIKLSLGRISYIAKPYGSEMCWGNWYQVWGHGCDTTDSQMSPQPRHSRGCGDIWESMVSQPWPKTMCQFIFYHGTTKLTLNYESLSSQTASRLPNLKSRAIINIGSRDLIILQNLATIVMSQKKLKIHC